MKGLALALLLGATACAGRPEGTKTPAAQMTAARIYAVAEEQVAAEHYAEAVQLIRHALLQLPERADADELRHRLVLRLAYVQMLAYQQTRERAFAEDAQRMLGRYLAKHEELFGDGEAARSERGEVYELLYTVETLSEAPEQAEPESESEPANARRVARAEAEPEPVDTHAGEELEEEMERKVRVRKRSKLAQPDDPRVRQRLYSTFADAEIAAVLTSPGVDLVHGPRPLVRARRASSASGSESAEGEKLARRLGRELLVEARPELRRCYEAAFARTTLAVTTGTVEASILPDGTVAKARIVEGGLADGLGDACLIERIEATRVAADTTRSTTRVRLPLVFFYEGAAYIDEVSGMGVKGAAPLNRDAPTTGVRGPMPKIDRFSR